MAFITIIQVWNGFHIDKNTTYKEYTMARFRSNAYDQLELFAKSIQNATGKVRLTGKSGEHIRKASSETFCWMKFRLEPQETYDLTAEQCTISLAYLSNNENAFEDGIVFLEQDENEWKQIGKAELCKFNDRPFREQYHFTPYKNWINDPNGLCWYQGYYHMFYQYNPHGQKWHNMYWGHAVSSNLVHWKHLPVVLEPQKEILEDRRKKGGAFSGSALVQENKVIFFLTRHLSRWDDQSPKTQYQVRMETTDMLHFSEETTIIEGPPSPDISRDFRDPKIFTDPVSGEACMVLGSCEKNVPAILLYRSDDLMNWRYCGPLLLEQEKGILTFECPDAFFLDDCMVVIGAWMEHTDEHGRYQMTRYYTGRLNGDHMEVKSQGWVDFGSNYYALQSFERDGKRIAIGWISDFYHEYDPVENGPVGSMAIPRILSVKNGALYMEPIPYIYELKRECLGKAIHKNLSLNILNGGNSYYARIILNKDVSAKFRILLARGRDSRLLLLSDGLSVRILTEGTKTEKISFSAKVTPQIIEIFMDRRVVEIFINQGQAAGTKIFCCDRTDTIFQTDFTDIRAVESVEVYRMESAWAINNTEKRKETKV